MSVAALVAALPRSFAPLRGEGLFLSVSLPLRESSISAIHSSRNQDSSVRKGNLISALCLGAFGIYVISVAAKLAYVSEVGPGPGFFPLWLGIGLVVFAAFLIFVSGSAGANREESQSSSWRTAGRALAGWLALMVAIALLGRIGFLLSFVVLTIFLVVVLDRRPALLAVGVGIGLAVAFQLVFVVGLDVSLPKGIWGF
jgi:putative tricarboxylic transport membrane protein